MKFSISEEILNKLLNVLAQRPYAEVAGIIQEVQQDAKPLVSDVDKDDGEEAA